MKVCAFWSKTPVLLCLWCLPLSFLCHYNIINIAQRQAFFTTFRLHIAQQKAVYFGDLALFSKCGIWYNKSVGACEASGPCADATRVRHGYGAQLVGPDITDDTSELQLSVIFTVGCDVLGTPLLSELHYLHRRGGHWPPTQREDIT